MRTMHLFAGAGGGLLADLILGHVPIVAVEWDKYCCAVLRVRAADGWFPGLRVHEQDIRLFDPSEYAGSVDCIHAGFPCQDLSIAGNRAGLPEGTRSGLYREVLRIAWALRPRYLFLENVSAILVSGLGTVLGDLATGGYDCRWTCLPASAAGAPHYRDRWWGLAVRADADRQRELQSERRESDEWEWSGDLGKNVPDALRERSQGVIPSESDTEKRAKPGEGSSGPRNNGIRWWAVEPNVGRVAHGLAARAHRIRSLGNGQVPIQAAAAWKLLGGP